MDLVWLRDAKSKVALLAQSWRSEPSASGLSFYAPRFYRHDSQKPWLCGETTAWPEFVADKLPLVTKRRVPDAEAFRSIHSEILSGIRERRFSKVVPFVSEEIEFDRRLNWRMYPAAFSDPGSQFAYGFEFKGEGMCGITPELLFEVRDGVLQTMALAGTGPIGGPSLLDNPKEMLEHQIVIDHICEALKGLGKLDTSPTREQDYPFLKHLLTPIRVRLRQSPSFLDLVSRLHPTAALGGHPRTAALDFLRVRGGERTRFGAPFGYADGGTMMCVVAIRSLQWSGASATLMSGCGVVEGSQPEREWNELALKRRSTERQLGLSL